MPAIPSLRTWTAGELATAALLNSSVRDPVTFFQSRPMIFCYISGNQSIADDGAWHLVLWNATLVDTENGRSDVGSTPGRNYAIRSGLYDIRSVALFAADVDSSRGLKIERVTPGGTRTVLVEAGQFSSCGSPNGGANTVETAVQVGDPGFYLDAGDYLEVFVRQHAGASLNLMGAANDSLTWFNMRWVASS